MKNFLIIIILLISPLIYSQNRLVVVGNDTLVTLNLQEVKKINQVYAENNSFKQEILILDSIINLRTSELEDQISINEELSDISQTQEEVIKHSHYILKATQDRLEILEKRKKWYIGGSIGIGSICTALLFIL